MKEIAAISKLAHKNIVGYKGCWVEADEPNQPRLDKIMKKLHRGKGCHKEVNDAISEQSSDDQEFVMNVELNEENDKRVKEKGLVLMNDQNSSFDDS